MEDCIFILFLGRFLNSSYYYNWGGIRYLIKDDFVLVNIVVLNLFTCITENLVCFIMWFMDNL